MIDFEIFEVRVVDLGLHRQFPPGAPFSDAKTIGGRNKQASIWNHTNAADGLSFAADVYLGEYIALVQCHGHARLRNLRFLTQISYLAGFIFWSMMTSLPLMI